MESHNEAQLRHVNFLGTSNTGVQQRLQLLATHYASGVQQRLQLLATHYASGMQQRLPYTYYISIDNNRPKASSEHDCMYCYYGHT